MIPARGGSKGIPGKNLKEVGGVPLVARSIQAAQASALVTRVVVSTDDDAIASVSLEYGADVVRRPDALADDTASSESALLHALDLFADEGPLPASIVFLQCTSPFTTGEQIDRVLTALQPERHRVPAVAPWHGFLWREDGRGINHDPQQPGSAGRTRSPFLKPARSMR